MPNSNVLQFPSAPPPEDDDYYAPVSKRDFEHIHDEPPASYRHVSPPPSTTTRVDPTTVDHDDDSGDKPKIIVTGRSADRIVREAWGAVLRFQQDRIFRRGKHTLLILSDNGDGSLKIKNITTDQIYGMLIRSARWIKLRRAYRGEETSTEWVEVEDRPPFDIPRDMVAFPHPLIREMLRIQYNPFAYADVNSTSLCSGVVTEEGYHAASRSFLHRPGRPPIPKITMPQAVAFVRDWLCDFPFQTPSDVAHAVALFILPMVRHLIDGPTPFHYIDAATQGTGKSLLVKVIAAGGVGRRVGVRPWSVQEEERRKAMTTIIRNGEPMAIFDNIRGRIDSPAMEAAVTAQGWNERLLGGNDEFSIERVTTIWAGTSNNAFFSVDMLRRSLRIRLVRTSINWKPETDARHPAIESYTDKNVEMLAACGVAMINAWVDAGCPAPRDAGRSLGSYEQWWHVVGGILEVCGIGGFLHNRSEWEGLAQPDQIEWDAFFRRWFAVHKEFEISTNDALNLCDHEPKLLTEASVAVDPIDKRRHVFGRVLMQHKDRVVLGGTHQVAVANFDGHPRFRLLAIASPGNVVDVPPVDMPPPPVEDYIPAEWNDDETPF